MDWTQVIVIEAPKIVESELRVRPPAYSGWPTESTERVARVLAGSQLTVSGRLDRPASAVRLRADNEPGRIWEAALSADGLSFHLPKAGQGAWLAEKSGVLSFELQDESGIVGAQDNRIELQVISDAPPAIAWETPTDQTFVTPRAIVPIQALVKDDLAVGRVTLKFLLPGATDSDERAVELYSATREGIAASEADAHAPREGQSLPVAHPWDLAKLGLRPGDVLAVRLEAADFKPQTATTSVRRISVVDDADFENRVVQQQTSVFTQLGEALRLQRDAHGQVAALQIQLEETNNLLRRDIDQLQGAELVQRQVQRLLSDPGNGVAARLAQLLDELANNRIENENIVRRLADLQTRVVAIERDSLLDVAQQLTIALKSGRALDTQSDVALAAERLQAVSTPLNAAEVQQRRVIEQLEGLLEELSEWDNFSRLAREVGQIREQQEKLRAETESLRWKIAAAAGEQPSADQRASARQLAVKQQDLARRFDKLQTRMDELRGRIEAADPRTAGTLGEASEVGRRLAVGGLMRQAGRELTELRVGAGQQTQQRVLESLGELLDTLSSRRDRELLRTVESLQVAQNELDLLREQQRQLAAMADEAATKPQEQEQRRQLLRLGREQEELARQADELRRKLERLQANRPAESASAGAQSMHRAGAAAQEGDAAQAGEQAREASRLLDEARERLQQEINQAQADLVREQLARLEQSIEALAVRQAAVISEIGRLEAAREPSGDLPGPQQATLEGIAGEQQLLAEEVEQLRRQLTETSAFYLALEGVRREMQRSAERLAKSRTDAETSQAAQAAHDRLQQMLSVLKEESSDAPMSDAGQEDAAGGEQDQPKENLVRSLAELRLLAEMQSVINRRTAEIEQQRLRNGRLTVDEEAALTNLAAEQGRLAKMIGDLAGKRAETETDLPPIPPADRGEPAAAPKPGELPSLDEQLLRDLLETP